MTLDDMKAREQEYRVALREKIRTTHAGFLKTATLAGDKKPLRHPKHGEERHTVRHLWSDALWCGDISIEWPMEFFEVDLSDMEMAEKYFMDDHQEYWNNIFDEEYRTLAAELGLPLDVLEG
jgi:hypothetical protein